MLTLTRKIGESFDIYLDDKTKINICIIKAGRGKARVAIDAPPRIKVLRSELTIQTSKRKAEAA
jgi:carbon storage regulator CsrA